MIIPHAIFLRESLQPLLDIWNKIEADVSSAWPQPRSGDMAGEFAVLANAMQTMAQKNSDMLGQFQKTKDKRLAHEAICEKRVQETYNDYVRAYNTERRNNAIAIGPLCTASKDDIVSYPGPLLKHDDPIDYALQLACFHKQYWASAVGFLHYLRCILNVYDPTKMLCIAADRIEENYLVPLEKRATEKWLTLLVIGGSAGDLQLAREALAGPYISGNCDSRVFLNNRLGCDDQHPGAPRMRDALVRAVMHPRSNLDPQENATIVSDLGLDA